MPGQRVQVDVLDGLALAALGLADAGPAGAPVAVGLEAGPVHEGLHQYRPVAVVPMPVLRQRAGAW